MASIMALMKAGQKSHFEPFLALDIVEMFVTDNMQNRHGYKARWCDEQIKWAKAAAEGKGAEAIADTKDQTNTRKTAFRNAKNKILTEAEKAQIIAARDKKQPAMQWLVIRCAPASYQQYGNSSHRG